MSKTLRSTTLILGSLVGLLITSAQDTWAAPPTPTAQYKATFLASWSAATHPTQFPPGPHFSGLVGGTHDSMASFWDVGQLASPGIQNMAENGAKNPLIGEVNAQITAGHAGAVISGGGLSPSPGQVAVSFTATQSFSRVTLVTMIAPSPDWFLGVSGVDLLAGGQWGDRVEVDLFAYDAGTDSGPTYTSSNQPTVPHVPIFAITGTPFTPGVPLGKFVFQRTDTPSPWADLGGSLAGTHGAPVLNGSGTPTPGQTVTLSLSGALENSSVALVVGLTKADLPVYGGLLVPSPDVIVFGLPTSATGTLVLAGPWPTGLAPGTNVFVQEWITDAAAPFGLAASNALCGTVK